MIISRLSSLLIKSYGEKSNHYKQLLNILFEIKLMLPIWGNQGDASSFSN